MCLLTVICSQAQTTVTGDRVVAKNGLYVKNAWIDSLSNDTTAMNNHRSVMTNDAVRKFVEGRLLNVGSKDSIYRQNDSIYWMHNGTIFPLGTYLTKNAANLLYSALGHNHDASYVSLTGSYTNPSWLVSIPVGKLTGLPSEFTPSNGSNYYIQNRTTTQTANFNINGYGILGSYLRLGNLAIDPTATNGAMYYSTANNHVRLLANSLWKNVLASNEITTDGTYTIDVTGNGRFRSPSNKPLTVVSTYGASETELNISKGWWGEWFIGDNRAYKLMLEAATSVDIVTVPLVIAAPSSLRMVNNAPIVGEYGLHLNFNQWADTTSVHEMLITWGPDKLEVAKFTKNGFVTSNDIELTNTTKGIIMKSPNGTRFRITVNDSGTLTSTQITN